MVRIHPKGVRGAQSVAATHPRRVRETAQLLTRTVSGARNSRGSAAHYPSGALSCPSTSGSPTTAARRSAIAHQSKSTVTLEAGTLTHRSGDR